MTVMSNCSGSGIIENLLKGLHTVVKFFKTNEMDYLGSDRQSFSWLFCFVFCVVFSFTEPGSISLSLILT